MSRRGDPSAEEPLHDEPEQRPKQERQRDRLETAEIVA